VNRLRSQKMGMAMWATLRGGDRIGTSTMKVWIESARVLIPVRKSENCVVRQRKIRKVKKSKNLDVSSLTGGILYQPDETHLDQSCLHLTETALVDASFVVPVKVEDVGSTENEVGREC
jgi:hypothetical protein